MFNCLYVVMTPTPIQQQAETGCNRIYRQTFVTVNRYRHHGINLCNVIYLKFPQPIIKRGSSERFSRLNACLND